MGSTSGAQSYSTQFAGQEHSSHLNQPQTVSLRDVNDEESTNYPTVRPNWNPITNKQSRGYTGKPRGRPPGAKNKGKPKDPQHDLPKVARRRGRPQGAGNKFPDRPWKKQKTPTSTVAEAFFGWPQRTLPEDQTTRPSVSTPIHPANSLTTMATPSSFTPMDAEDFLTPATTPYPTLTFSSSTNQGGYGYQYPSPSSYGEAFGNGHFTYNNSINSSSSGDAFTSSTPYQGGRPAHWDQTQPPEGMTEYGRHNLPAPAAPQAYDASSSVVDAENSLPRLRPCSSIAGSEARNLSPAPTTPGPYYTDFLDWSEENDPDNFFTQVSAREREAAEMDFGIADGI